LERKYLNFIVNHVFIFRATITMILFRILTNITYYLMIKNAMKF